MCSAHPARHPGAAPLLAGVRWNIGVLSGTHDRQSLASVAHTHLLPCVAEVTGLWAAG